MTERAYRVFLGATLLVILYWSAIYQNYDLMYGYIGLLLFEGITNWRIPALTRVLRYRILGQVVNMAHGNAENHFVASTFSFEAERALRLVLVLLLILPFFWATEILWILPWFIACMLLLAGVTNICPMVMFFRWLGFK